MYLLKIVLFSCVNDKYKPFYKERYNRRNLPNADRYSDGLVRLPLYYELEKEDVNRVIRNISLFFENIDNGDYFSVLHKAGFLKNEGFDNNGMLEF